MNDNFDHGDGRRQDEADEVRRAISEHIYPSQIVGQVSWSGDEWRALVAVNPSGPLLLMAFTVTERYADGTCV